MGKGKLCCQSPQKEEGTTVLLVDRHRLVRESLAEFISTRGGFRVVGSTGSGREAISLVCEKCPDIMLIEYNLDDGLQGSELLKSIRALCFRVRMVVLSAITHGDIVEEAMSCGASAYLGKDCSPEELMATLQSVSDGEIPECKFWNPKSKETFCKLTDRERAILRLIARGFPIREIATSLCISSKTVETHRLNIRIKLGIDSSDALRAYARDYFG